MYTYGKKEEKCFSPLFLEVTEYTIQTTLSSFHSSNIRSSAGGVYPSTFHFIKGAMHTVQHTDRYAYAHANQKGMDQRSTV